MSAHARRLTASGWDRCSVTVASGRGAYRLTATVANNRIHVSNRIAAMSQSDSKPFSSACWLSRSLHASLAVRDLDASIAFYEGSLGFRCTFRANELADEVARLMNRAGLACRLAQMRRPGEEVIELIEFRPIDGSRPTSGDGVVPMGHLAFAVTDLNAALEAVCAAGAKPLGDVVLFPEGRCVYAREPGGSVFEFEEILDENNA